MRSIFRLNARRQTRRFLVGPVLAALLTALLFPGAAVAVHDTGVFELDGNATTNSTTMDDWDEVCHEVVGSDCSTSSNTSGAKAVAWAAEANPNSTIFTGGGSKDPIDINQWAWKDGAGGLPDKDNLEHAFAARYSLPPSASCPSGGAPTCEVIFFGSDRFDNSGDAQQGFWFFQNAISLGTQKLGGGQGFNGVHMNGDILVISDFSNGGTTSTISIYKWNSAVSGNLELLATSSAAKCSTAAAGDGFCGIVNPTDGTAAPWPFLDKSGNTTYLNGELYEGGINLSLLGLGNECFASVAAESRSSTSTTATLKDFVLATFGACTSTIRTTASGTTFSIGTGSVSVTDSATLTVGGAATWSGTVAFSLCGPIPTGTCNTGGTAISSQGVTQSTPQPIVSSAATVTSVGRYCWRADFTSSTSGVPGATDDGSGTTPNPECFVVNPVTPTLTTQASGPIQLGGMISDTATLTGTANKPGTPVINPTTAGDPAGGTITFTVYGPNNCTTVAFDPVNVAVNGDGPYPSGSFQPTAVGTYTFVASYSGDSPNTNPAPATGCPDTTGTETVLVRDTTGIATAQNWLPNDSATVTSAGGSALSGTLTLTLYDNGSCNGNVLYTTGAMPVSGASPQTLSSSNTLVKVLATATGSWKATYTSNDGNVAGSTSNCETTSLTINN